MNKFQKRFLQFMLKIKICPQDLAIEALDAVYGSSDDQEDFAEFIEGVNIFIKKIDMEVVCGRSEVTGQESIALIQLCDKNSNQPTKALAKKASDLFSRLISQIVRSPNKKISETEAFNLGTQSGLSKAATQGALTDLTKGDWVEISEGSVFLGVRTILELGQFISSFYPNSAKPCTLCRKLSFYGTQCRDCGNVTHKPCIQKYSRQNGSYSCISCKENLTGANSQMDVEDNSGMEATSVNESISRAATPTPAKRPRLR